MQEQLSEWTRVDREKNRVYILLQGKVDIDRVTVLKDVYRKAVDQVKPGFTLVTHAEDFHPATPEVQKVLQEMTEISANRGVSYVARVVGETPIGGMQIDRLAKVKTTYPAKHFRTVKEAEQYLDEMDKAGREV